MTIWRRYRCLILAHQSENRISIEWSEILIQFFIFDLFIRV